MAAHNIEFHHEAGAEYDAAFDWYAARSPDAASKFDSEVHYALQDIAANPQRWAIGPLDTRRYLLRKFPFLVVYREISPNYIQIVAIAHTSRKPWFWKGRI